MHGVFRRESTPFRPWTARHPSMPSPPNAVSRSRCEGLARFAGTLIEHRAAASSGDGRPTIRGSVHLRRPTGYRWPPSAEGPLETTERGYYVEPGFAVLTTHRDPLLAHVGVEERQGIELPVAVDESLGGLAGLNDEAMRVARPTSLSYQADSWNRHDRRCCCNPLWWQPTGSVHR